MKEKWLVAIDSSLFSREAMLKAVHYSEQFQIELGLIYVIERKELAKVLDSGILIQELRAELRAEAESVLKEFSVLKPDGKVQSFVEEGDPADQILKKSIEWGASTIVMGTHGRTGLMSVIMGSVCRDVLQKSTLPVLIVPQIP